MITNARRSSITGKKIKENIFSTNKTLIRIFFGLKMKEYFDICIKLRCLGNHLWLILHLYT